MFTHSNTLQDSSFGVIHRDGSVLLNHLTTTREKSELDVLKWHLSKCLY